MVWENEAAPIPNASAHYTGSIKDVFRLYAETKGGTIYAALVPDSATPNLEFRIGYSGSGAIDAYYFVASTQERMELRVGVGHEFKWSRSGNKLVGISPTGSDGSHTVYELSLHGNEPYSVREVSYRDGEVARADPDLTLHKLGQH